MAEVGGRVGSVGGANCVPASVVSGCEFAGEANGAVKSAGIAAAWKRGVVNETASETDSTRGFDAVAIGLGRSDARSLRAESDAGATLAELTGEGTNAGGMPFEEERADGARVSVGLAAMGAAGGTTWDDWAAGSGS